MLCAPDTCSTSSTRGRQTCRRSLDVLRAESPQSDSPSWSEHRERRPERRVLGFFWRPEGTEQNTHSRPVSLRYRADRFFRRAFHTRLSLSALPEVICQAPPRSESARLKRTWELSRLSCTRRRPADWNVCSARAPKHPYRNSSDESGLEIQFHKYRSSHSCKVSSASLKKFAMWISFRPPVAPRSQKRTEFRAPSGCSMRIQIRKSIPATTPIPGQ